jgi:Ser/Thr protein kinase RdoA (MazF antagonist)
MINPTSPLPPDGDLLHREITRRYDLGVLAECSLVHKSFNSVYRIVTSSGDFFVRVGGARSQAAVGSSYEVDLLCHLAGRGVPVARPVAMRDGEYVWHINEAEGQRAVVLFTSAPGEHLGSPFPSRAFGQTAAALHDALDDFVGPQPQAGLDWRYLVAAPVAAVQSFVQHRPEIGRFLTRIATALRLRYPLLITR